METITAGKTSVLGLIRNLKTEVTEFIREEIRLAKTELSEKMSLFGRNAVSLAIGGFVAYAGLIVFCLGLGLLVAYAFEQAGLSGFMAGFIGLGAMGLLVILAGAAFIFKALSTFKQESIAPQRTLYTLQELRGPQTVSIEEGMKMKAEEMKEKAEEKLSSKELQSQVEATEAEMSSTLQELAYRLSPRALNRRIKKRIEQKPYKIGLIAMCAGLFSGFMLKQRFKKA
jgi:ElaB/YqjD/DUF883 family membrane-anchored ribosome-binding protein